MQKLMFYTEYDAQGQVNLIFRIENEIYGHTKVIPC